MWPLFWNQLPLLICSLFEVFCYLVVFKIFSLPLTVVRLLSLKRKKALLVNSDPCCGYLVTAVWVWAGAEQQWERERERGIKAISVTWGLALLPPSNMSCEFKGFFRSPKPLPSWWMENAFCSIPVFRDERLSRLRGASASSLMLPMSEPSIKGFLIFNSYCRHHPPGFLGLTSTQYPFDFLKKYLSSSPPPKPVH